MTRTVCRYTFDPRVSIEEAEETLILSLYGAEGLLGAARVRNETGYLVDMKTRTFVVDASTEVGDTVVRLFTGYATKEFGADAFRVERIVRDEADEVVDAGEGAAREPGGPSPTGAAR